MTRMARLLPIISPEIRGLISGDQLSVGDGKNPNLRQRHLWHGFHGWHGLEQKEKLIKDKDFFGTDYADGTVSSEIGGPISEVI